MSTEYGKTCKQINHDRPWKKPLVPRTYGIFCLHLNKNIIVLLCNRQAYRIRYIVNINYALELHRRTFVTAASLELHRRTEGQQLLWSCTGGLRDSSCFGVAQEDCGRAASLELHRRTVGQQLLWNCTRGLWDSSLGQKSALSLWYGLTRPYSQKLFPSIWRSVIFGWQNFCLNYC